jgi:MFS family permease
VRSFPLYALFAASAVSVTGNTLTALAVPWFVLQTTGSATKTGLAAFCTLIAFVISSGLSGPLVDRLGHRRTSVLADLASGLSVLAIPLLFHTTGLPLWGLLALVFCGAVLDAPGDAARGAILPELVERSGMRMERAMSWHDGVSRGARMIGAPLSGVLIATVGTANVLFLDAATFAVSALLVGSLVPTAARVAVEVHEPYFRALRGGASFLWNDALTRAIVLMVVVTNMLDAAMGSVLMPVYADRVLDSVVALGLISGAFGLGATAGAVVFGWLGHRLPRVTTLVVGFSLGGCFRFFFLPADPSLPLILALVPLAGIGIGMVNPIFGVCLYERIPEHMRARVFGVMSAAVMSAAPLGALLAGYFVAWFGVRETMVAFGVVYAVCTLSPLVVPAWRDANAAPRAAPVPQPPA